MSSNARQSFRRLHLQYCARTKCTPVQCTVAIENCDFVCRSVSRWRLRHIYSTIHWYEMIQNVSYSFNFLVGSIVCPWRDGEQEGERELEDMPSFTHMKYLTKRNDRMISFKLHISGNFLIRKNVLRSVYDDAFRCQMSFQSDDWAIFLCHISALSFCSIGKDFGIWYCRSSWIKNFIWPPLTNPFSFHYFLELFSRDGK